MRFEPKVKPFIGRFDVAAFAGVFFLLVLLLLLNTPLIPTPGIRVGIRLPSARLTELPGVRNPALVVTVDRFEQFYFEDQLIQPERLEARLAARVKAAKQPVTLVVYADTVVQQGAMVRLAALAQRAGIADLLVVTRPPLPVPVARPANNQ